MNTRPQRMRPASDVESVAAGDGELSHSPADALALNARLARIERAIGEQLQANDEQVAALTDAVAALCRRLDRDAPPLAQPAAAAPGELVPRAVVEEIEAAAERELAALRGALAAIEKSTTWRATAPVRSLASRLPPHTRAALRRLARRAFWVLTPHRMAMRRQWFVYAPQDEQTGERLASLSREARERLKPLRRAYGPTAVEQMDIYPAARPDAPIFVFVHGGGWRATEARNAAFAAETFVGAGATYVALDFIGSQAAGGDLRVIVEQVCRGIAWVYRNAAGFGGNPDRLYVGGHSSGGHLCAMALAGEWPAALGLPGDAIKGAVLMSGIYDLKSTRAAKSARNLVITDEIEQAMSPRRHVARLRAPVVITCGGSEAPEFRQQSHDLFAAATAAGKTAELIEAAYFGHLEMAESLGGPYGPNGRAALRLMGLCPPR